MRRKWTGRSRSIPRGPRDCERGGSSSRQRQSSASCAALAGLRATTLDEAARHANEWAALLDRRASDEDNAGSDPTR
jgi:hypothetical protein